MLPVEGHEKSRISFEIFCKTLLTQYGVELLGDGRSDPSLLHEADVIFIAGEGTDEENKRRDVATLIKNACGNKVKQVLIGLPNRAYLDPPSGLKAQRKQRWLHDLPSIQIHRPLILPDMETLGEVIADANEGEGIFTGGFLSTSSYKEPMSQRGDASTSEPGSAEQRPADVGADTPQKATDASSILLSPQYTPDSNRGRAHPQSSPGERDRRCFTCLVVEDNPLNARILVTLLKRASIQYFEARDGVEAVEMFTKHLPQVVLLDINLPRMNGFDAAKEMRKVLEPFEGYRARIVAVTALSAERDKLRGFDSGIDDWLTKPVRLAQLAHDVKAWKEEWEKQIEAEDCLSEGAAEGKDNGGAQEAS